MLFRLRLTISPRRYFAPVCIALLLSSFSACKSWGKFWEVFEVGELTALYTSAQLWNDYIVADGSAIGVRGVSASASSGVSSRLNASGTACSSAATGGYGVCIHAGLMRQSYISNKTDCSGITASDALGAFIWVCDASTVPVRLIAVGLNEGKYLSDLIDFDQVAFRPNALRATIDSVEYASPSTVWYKNSVTNFTVANYGSTSGIVLLQTNPASATTLTPAADKTALVMRPGISLTTTSGAAAINNSARNFSWFEGNINLAGAAGTCIGLALSNGRFVVVQNFSIVNSPATSSTAFQINGSNSYYRDARYANATVANHTSFDLVTGGDGNILQGMITTNDEFSLKVRSTNNTLLNLTSANSATPSNVNIDYQTGNSNNVGINILSGNNGTSGGIGAFRTSSGANNTVMNLAVANTPNPAYSGAGSTGSQLINLALHSSATPSLLVSASTFTYIGGSVKLAFGACTTAAPDAGLTAGCGTANSSDFTLLSNAVAPAATFVGKVTTDDSQNTSDANGSSAYATGMDWTHFTNRFRGFGIDGGTFPVVGNQGRCTAGSCRIWDWSLRSSDSEFRNVLTIPTGNNTAAHKWSAAAQANCTQLGAAWNGTGTCNYPPYPGTAGTCGTWTGGSTATAACLTTFLRNAYEIIGDGIGNENGLCESNEACIYTPNISSYQGHGGLTCIRGPSEYGCQSTFSDGAISGVVLYQYAANGY
jgi:hypothetical protein